MATASERLVEAEAAYHAIMTGKGVQRVRDQSGDEISYTTGNATRLWAYIQSLKAEIAGKTVQRGPIRPYFA